MYGRFFADSFQSIFFGFLVAIVLLIIIVGTLGYCLGQSVGREEVYQEAIKNGHYIQVYDSQTGARIRHWKNVEKN